MFTAVDLYIASLGTDVLWRYKLLGDNSKRRLTLTETSSWTKGEGRSTTSQNLLSISLLTDAKFQDILEEPRNLNESNPHPSNGKLKVIHTMKTGGQPVLQDPED